MAVTPSKASSSVSSAQAVPAAASGVLLFFELEHVLVPGRELMLGAMRDVLAKEGIEVSPALLLQYAECPRPELCLADLVKESGSTKDVTEKMVADVNEAIQQGIAGLEIRKPVMKWIEAALARNMEVAAVSYWPEEWAQLLYDHLALAALDVRLIVLKDVEKPFPQSTSIATALDENAPNSHWFLGLVSSAAACHATLAARSHCLVFPDAYTEFHDFGGADDVLDDPDKLDPAETIEQMFPRLRPSA